MPLAFSMPAPILLAGRAKYVKKPRQIYKMLFTKSQFCSKIADFIIKQAIQNGTFDSLYADAWEKVKYEIPENLKVIG